MKRRSLCTKRTDNSTCNRLRDQEKTPVAREFKKSSLKNQNSPASGRNPAGNYLKALSGNRKNNCPILGYGSGFSGEPEDMAVNDELYCQ